MESKGGKKFNFKIGSIVAIAVVAAIVGTLAFTSYETNSDSPSYTQSVGIGAYVTVEAYHEDGTLFHKWEGHNALSFGSRNSLVACNTGLDNTPNPFGSCQFDINQIGLSIQNQIDDSFVLDAYTESSTLLPTPDNCDFDVFNNPCTGWTMISTFDFDQLSCTETVDCINVTSASSKGDIFQFNVVLLEPSIPIIPNDRLVVTMNFTIPE